MIRVEVRCDGCLFMEVSPRGWSQGVRRRPIHVIRERLKKLGWHIIPDEGKDYCPECWARMKNKECDKTP